MDKYLIFILLFFAYACIYDIFKVNSTYYKTINNELDKAKQQKIKLKEDIKHIHKGVGLDKHKKKQIDEHRKHIQKQDDDLIRLVSK